MINKIKKILTDKNFIMSLICLVFGLIYIIYIHSNIEIRTGFKNQKYDIFYWSISTILLLLLISIIYFYIMKDKLKTHVLFIVLAIIFGGAYLTVAPIQNGSDEVAHFYRIFEVATGQFCTQKNEEGIYIEKDVPISLIEVTDSKNADMSIKLTEILNKAKIDLNKDEKIDKLANTGASVYSPIVYAPQSIGMAIGLLLNLKPIIIANLARVFGFVTWLLVCAYSIKIIPNKKEFLLLLALMPANITSAVTLSADTILNSFSLLLIAKVIQVTEKQEKINIKDYLMILGASIVIGQCKIAYIPLIFICFLIPMEKYKNKKTYWLVNTGIILATLLFSLVWLKLIGQFYSSTGEGQKEWILANPISYIIVMFRTAAEYFSKLFYGVAAGEDLYQARVKVSGIISFALMICLMISLFIKESKFNIKILKKIIVLGISMMIIVLVVTAMYVSATTILTQKTGTEIIQGIQGRYFIPVIALCVFLFRKKIINLEEKYIYSTFTMLQFAVILHTLGTFI